MKQHQYHSIGHDSLIQTILINIPKKQAIQPGDAFEDAAFKLGFEIVKF
jgi:hypothetical protein